jgi:hypothetical protein
MQILQELLQFAESFETQKSSPVWSGDQSDDDDIIDDEDDISENSKGINLL